MVDFTKLRTMTPEEVAAIPAEKPDPDYIRRNTELAGNPPCPSGKPCAAISDECASGCVEQKWLARTVTIILPPGYASAEEFAKDCGFELVAPSPS